MESTGMRLFSFSVCSFFLLCSCQRAWTEKDKADFLAGCIEGTTKDLGADKAKAYCACMVGKVVSRYPDAGDAKYMKYDTAIVRISKDCLKQP